MIIITSLISLRTLLVWLNLFLLGICFFCLWFFFFWLLFVVFLLLILDEHCTNYFLSFQRVFHNVNHNCFLFYGLSLLLCFFFFICDRLVSMTLLLLWLWFSLLLVVCFFINDIIFYILPIRLSIRLFYLLFIRCFFYLLLLLSNLRQNQFRTPSYFRALFFYILKQCIILAL